MNQMNPRSKHCTVPPLSLIESYTREGDWECDFSIDGVLNFMRENEEERDLIKCDFDPDFQRGHVWTRTQQRDWLVHFFRGGSNGRRLFFNLPGWRTDYHGTLELIDGKQRIEAIRAFLNDEVCIWGHTYSEFCPTKTDHRKMMNINSMRINVNNLPNRQAVLQWYLEMNAGGTPHTDSELRKVRDMLAGKE